MEGPSIDFTSRFELDFVLAMETDKLGDDLWDEIFPGAVRSSSDGTNDNLILEYAASRLQEYQPGKQLYQYESTSFNGFVAESQDSAKARRLVSARLLSPVIDATYIDKIFPELRHIQNVLAKDEPEYGDQQWQFDRGTKKFMSCNPENAGSAFSYPTTADQSPSISLVVLWAYYEQALEQLQPRHCHRPPSINDREIFTDTVNNCTNLSELQEILGLFASTDGSAKIKPLMVTKPSTCGRTQELHVRSVEIREHAGTLQADDMYWWMRLTLKIMQYAQWLTDKDFAFLLYGVANLTDLLEVINFARGGMEFYLKKMKELVRMEKVARTEKVTTVEEVGRIEEKPAPPHGLARIHELEHLEEHLAQTENEAAPIPWSP